MKYFAYGMNTNIQHMSVQCPDAVCLGVAWIDNYSLVFRNHADITPNSGQRCWGVLWEITEKDLMSLDMLEGYPFYYVRFSIAVNQENSPTTSALVYQMANQSSEKPPSVSYYNILVNGYLANNVPTEQLG